MPFGELITGIRQPLRELGELHARFRERDAVADEDHRPLGREQPVDAAARRPPREAPLRRSLKPSQAGS